MAILTELLEILANNLSKICRISRFYSHEIACPAQVGDVSLYGRYVDGLNESLCISGNSAIIEIVFAFCYVVFVYLVSSRERDVLSNQG